MVLFTVTLGGATGFTLSWISPGASLVAIPPLISILFIRSIAQYFANQKNYWNFKKLVDKISDDDKLKETFRIFFVKGKVFPTTSIEMKPWD